MFGSIFKYSLLLKTNVLGFGRQNLGICKSGCPADRHWALVRDDVSPLQHPQTGTCLQAASNPVHAAPPEEGSPDGVGPSSHVSGPWCEGA